MPVLSKLTHCVLCASPEHKAPNCPRRKLRADAKAAVRSAAKEARLAAAVAKKAAVKAKADAKRLAARAIVMATKARKDDEDAFHNTVYNAIVSTIAPMPQTACNYKNSRWAVAVDVCVRCERGPLGCMCL
jgi:hypothetical protein